MASKGALNLATGHFAAPLQLRFKDFYFGGAEAEKEAADHPDLLLHAFIDHQGTIEEARNGRSFLFLGYKGSGKSALAEHLYLLKEPELFVKVVHIADLPFANLGQIVEGGAEPESRFPTAWSWLLLVQLFDLFSQDEGSELYRNEHLWSVIETLQATGFLPNAKLTKTLETTLKKTYALKLWDIVNIGRERTEKSNTDLPCFVECLRANAASFKSNSKHLLIIDGLDDLLRTRKLAHTALECLLFESKRLNNEFSKAGTPAKIIVLCRTDLFDKLPSANKNKLRQDYGVNLDWSDHLHNPRRAALVQIINQRASLQYGNPIDVFEKFLPRTIEAGGEIRGQLLDHTRRTPRDMVMLFKYLQRNSGKDRMTPGQVWEGLAEYSKEYLVGELKDELGGYAESHQIDSAVHLFMRTRKAAVSVAHLEDQANKLYGGTLDQRTVRDILRVLFECSLIGTAPTVNSNSTEVHFKFKNRHARFDPFQAVFFHRGLWKGLNLRP